MTFAYASRGNKIYPVDHLEHGEMSVVAGDAVYNTLDLFDELCVACQVRGVPKTLTSQFATKWDRPNSSPMAWIRVKTRFATIRAVDLRLRGRRRRLVGLSSEESLAPSF